MHSSFYPADSGNQDNLRMPVLDLIQKARAVRQAAQKNNIIKIDCFDQVDRPLRDLSCEAGGFAGPVYWAIHPEHKETQVDRDLVWAMCCSAVITGQRLKEAQ